MIITRTPFRISFFGGGTDYPDWYRIHGGSVLSTTIDKYCYISCRHLPPFFDHKHRIVYSQIEQARSNQDIKHPAVKAIFNWACVSEGLEIHYDGDLPARSGLGSSSAFSVGLIHALYGIRGRLVDKELLAKDAINVEQNIIGESVGSQDQIAAAYGGLNKIDFHRDDNFSVSPLVISTERKSELQNHLMLCFTGFSRIANEVAQSKIKNFQQREKEIFAMSLMVDEAVKILTSTNISINEFGNLLNETWKYKRGLSDRVTTPEIDEIYDIAMKAGALGGKLLGAGGGGFMLIFAKPEDQQNIRDKLNSLVHVNFKFDNSGSRVALYQPEGF